MSNETNNKKGTSIVTIKYDSIHHVIEKIKQEFDMTQLRINDNEFCDVNLMLYYLPLQIKLRELIEKYEDLFEYNYKTATLGCQNMFAIIIAICSDLSICNSWKDLMKQWEDYHNISYTFESDNSEDYDENNNNTKDNSLKRCCCGHPFIHLKNQYLVTNTLTNLTLLIGCDCIEKKLLINMADEKRKRKQDIKNKEKEKIAAEELAKWNEQLAKEKIKNAIKAKQAAERYALQKAELEAKQALELAAKIAADQEAKIVAEKEAILLAELKHKEIENKPLIFRVFYKQQPNRFIWLGTKWKCII